MHPTRDKGSSTRRMSSDNSSLSTNSNASSSDDEEAARAQSKLVAKKRRKTAETPPAFTTTTDSKSSSEMKGDPTKTGSEKAAAGDTRSSLKRKDEDKGTTSSTKSAAEGSDNSSSGSKQGPLNVTAASLAAATSLLVGAPPAASEERQPKEATSSSEPPTADTTRLNFPGKLMELLNRPDKPDGIYWLPEGNIFAMQTQKMEDILVQSFQGAKLLSFTRTLNKWYVKKNGTTTFSIAFDGLRLLTISFIHFYFQGISQVSGSQLAPQNGRVSARVLFERSSRTSQVYCQLQQEFQQEGQEAGTSSRWSWFAAAASCSRTIQFSCIGCCCCCFWSYRKHLNPITAREYFLVA